jgi:hypothetical protein
VKRPACIPDRDVGSRENTRSFRGLVRCLRDRGWVAMLACDSAGRIGFVVPDDDDGIAGAAIEDGESNCSALLYYAPMGEFIPWARANHLANDDVSAQRWDPRRRRRRDDR